MISRHLQQGVLSHHTMPIFVGDPTAPTSGPKLPARVGGVRSMFSPNKGLWGLKPGPCPIKSDFSPLNQTPHWCLLYSFKDMSMTCFLETIGSLVACFAIFRVESS